MTYWFKVLLWFLVWLTGQSMNVWQVTKYGFMPLTFPFGDWIPIAGRWLFSIGDILQVMAFIELFELVVTRELDHRYVRVGG